MKRVCFLMRIKPHLVEEYKQAHEPVWPEMLEAMREAGIHNYSIFLTDDGLLINYFESEVPQGSLAQVAGTGVSTRWQAYMSPYFESGSGSPGSAAPIWPEQVFCLE